MEIVRQRAEEKVLSNRAIHADSGRDGVRIGFDLKFGGRGVLRKPVINAVLGLAAIYGVVAIAKADAGAVSSAVDMTQTTPFVADYLGKPKPLLLFKGTYDDSSYLAGSYGSELDVTGQHSLLIFPDGEFALTWSCAVCKKPETTTLGTWKRTGNVLAFTIDSKEASVDQKPLSDMAFFVVTGDSGEYHSILVKEPIQNHVSYDGFLARIGQFSDWKADLQQAKAELGVDSRPLYLPK